jgi:hypothetical protein
MPRDALSFELQLSAGLEATEHKLDMLTRLLRRTHVAVKHPLLASRAFHTSPALRAIDMAKVDTTERLAELRKLMKERNVDVYSTHSLSRYPADTSLIYAQWYHRKTATRVNT